MHRSRFNLQIVALSAVWLIVSIGFLALLSLVSTSDRAVAWRTITLGLSASVIALPIGGLIAWVCRGEGRVPRTLLVSTIALLMVPMFIQVSGWDAAFGKLGWLTSTKGQILVPLVSGWTAASWIHGIAAAPQIALILLIGLSVSRREYEEQALLDTSAAGVFWNVTLRRLWPLLILSIAWIVISCAREIAVTDLYQIGTLAEQIYLGYSLGINSIAGTWTADQLADAGSLGVLLTISLVAWMSVTAFCFFIGLTHLEYQSDGWKPRPLAAEGIPRTVIGLMLLLVMVAVPIGNVVLRACFYVRPVDGVPTQGYSIQQLTHSIRRSAFDYREEFDWSFLIAVTSATLILLLALIFATAARRSRFAQVVFVITLAITCALPGPYIGTLIASSFSNLSNPTVHWAYNYTIAAPVLANLIFCWPVGALLVWFLFRNISQDALESASVEGAGGLRRFWHFGLQANALSLAGCWLISFAFCFGELSASQIVRPAGIDTVPRKMLGDLHAGVNEMTAGITIVTAFTIVSISLVGWWFIRLNQRRIFRK
jgi:ABC-type Fe3+ transport system permease subunit